MRGVSLSSALARALVACAVLFAAAAASAASPALPDFVTHPPRDLECDSTPFGRSVTFGVDAEFIEMMTTSGGLDAFDEYVLSAEAPPLERVFRADLHPGALAGTTFLKAIGVDLDGDGREEIVTANRVTATGALELGVFRRTGAPTAELVDTWQSAQTFDAVDLAAGDLDGSKNRQQELAVLLHTTSPFGLRVFVLTGAAGGAIAQADETAAGVWNRAISGVQNSSVTAGDMLLDGRAQIVVVNDSGSNADLALNYHLLEYQPTTAALPVASGDTAIGSTSFQSIVGFTYLADDTSTSPPIQHFVKLDADAGDVVDSAAAELVVHALFEDASGGDANNYIGQRLHHFIPTRTGDAITSIAFASRGAGMEYDWSHIVQGQNQNGIPSLEATIADVDRVSPAEIVLARSDPNSRLDVEAYKAKVDVAAYFAFEYTSSETVHFISQSTGAITSYHWDFGDGTTLGDDPSPTHHFPDDAAYTVTLTVHGSYGEIGVYSYAIDAGGGTAADPAGAPGYKYRTILAPAYSGAYPASFGDLADVNVAASDMDKDGIAEIMTSFRDTTEHWVRSIWHLEDASNPASFAGQHLVEDGSFGGIAGVDLVASDFDGDSVKATIGTDGCREVVEPQVRQIAWLPPYFHALQADADKAASFGKSLSGGTSNEQAWGSYTSHDISAYVGIDIGLDGIGGKVSAKATAGYNYQAANGEIHGTQNDQTLTQGWEQTAGEALVVYDENTFDCYTYDLADALGPLPDSRARMCELSLHNGVTGDDAENWDTQIAGGAGTGAPPVQWFPLHRDWANLALFVPARSNVSLPPETPASAVTDGLFNDSRASNGGATASNPYLEIDLGRERDITDIRVSPPPGGAIDLEGYRLYASQAPFAGDGVPSGAGVVEFEPGTGDDMAYDRWNIWTRDSATFAPMRARFIRLQHPGPATLNVAEIQVFGDVHVEPPAYPEAVCDPVQSDGFFNVKVWDSVNRQFRSIEQHGDLLWTGTDFTPDFPDGCSNWGDELPSLPIWNTQLIGGSAAATWELGSNSQVAVGNTTSFDSSYRVGAELDVEAGFIATVTAGAAYEFSSGVTEENTTTTYWGTGLEIAGEIGGFNDTALVPTCKYNARPYAYQLVDRSNTGYAHDIYVVDYVVTENGDGAVTAWSRGNVPIECLGLTDEIFASGFD